MADLTGKTTPSALEDALAVPSAKDANSMAKALQDMEKKWKRSTSAIRKQAKASRELKENTEGQSNALADLVKNMDKSSKGYERFVKATNRATKAAKDQEEALKKQGNALSEQEAQQKEYSEKLKGYAEAGWGKATKFIEKYGTKLAAGALVMKAATLALDEFSYSFDQHLIAGVKWDKSFGSIYDTMWRTNKVMAESSILAIKYGKSIDEVQQIARALGKGVGRGSLLEEGGEKKIIRLTEATLQFKRDLMLSGDEVANFFTQQSFRFGKTEEQYTGTLAMIRTAAEESNTLFGPGKGVWVDEMSQHIKALTMESTHYSQNSDIFVSAYQKVFDTVKGGTNNYIMAKEAAEKFTKALSAPPPWMMTTAGMGMVKKAQADWVGFSKSMGDVAPEVKSQIKDIVGQVGTNLSEFQAAQAIMELIGQENVGLEATFSHLKTLVGQGGPGGTQLMSSMFGMNYNEAIQTSKIVRENDFGAFKDMVKATKEKTKPPGKEDWSLSQMLAGGMDTVSSAVQAPFEDISNLLPLAGLIGVGGWQVKKRMPKWRKGEGLLGGLLGKEAKKKAAAGGGILGDTPILGGGTGITSSDISIQTATITVMSGNMGGGIGGYGVGGTGGGQQPPPLPMGMYPTGLTRGASGKNALVAEGASGKGYTPALKKYGGKGGRPKFFGKGGMGRTIGKGFGAAALLGGGLYGISSLLGGETDQSYGTKTGAGTTYASYEEYMKAHSVKQDMEGFAGESSIYGAANMALMGIPDLAISIAGSAIDAAKSTSKEKKFKRSGKSYMDLQIEQAKKNIQAEVKKKIAGVMKITPEAMASVEAKKKALMSGGRFGANDVKMPMRIDPASGNIILQGGYGEIVKMESKRQLLAPKSV